MKHFILMNLLCIFVFGVVPALPFMLIDHLATADQTN